jgi:hypothetical protein
VSLSRLWLFIAVALPVLAAVLAQMSSVDLTYQLRAGSEIVTAGAIPTVDTWTFTAAGVPWVDQQWGAQVVLATVFDVAGWTGLVLLRAALTGIIVGSTVLVAKARGLDDRTAALLALGAFIVAAPAMALRPQLLGMACFVLTLLIVAVRRDRLRLLWLVPVLTAVWANLHGSFVLAPVVLGLAWLEDLHDRVPGPHRTLLVGIVAAVAACLTPFGPAVWTYAVGLSTDARVTALTTEWQPTSIRDISGLLFFGSCAALVVLIARSGRRVPWPTIAWLGVFAALGTYAERGVAWWPFTAVAAVAGTVILPRPTPAVAEGSRRLNAAVAVGISIVIIALLPIWRPVDPKTNVPAAVLTDAPPGITEALRTLVRPGDRVFNAQRWGSWFEFALPTALYAVDSRIEFIPADVWSAYEGIMAGKGGWDEQLASWGASIAVLEQGDEATIARFEAAGWRPVHADEDGSVLMHTDRATGDASR